RNVDHPGLRIERNWRPIFSAVRIRTKLGRLAGCRFVRRIDIRTPCLGVEFQEYVLIHVRFAFHETNWARSRTLEEPEISIACDIDKAFDSAATASKVDEDRWR